MDKKLKELFDNNTPFAIMKHYTSAVFSDEVKVTYELIFKRGDKLRYRDLGSNAYHFINKNIERFKIAIQNEDGTVYDFGDFNNYRKQK